MVLRQFRDSVAVLLIPMSTMNSSMIWLGMQIFHISPFRAPQSSVVSSLPTQRCSWGMGIRSFATWKLNQRYEGPCCVSYWLIPTRLNHWKVQSECADGWVKWNGPMINCDDALDSNGTSRQGHIFCLLMGITDQMYSARGPRGFWPTICSINRSSEERRWRCITFDSVPKFDCLSCCTDREF